MSTEMDLDQFCEKMERFAPAFGAASFDAWLFFLHEWISNGEQDFKTGCNIDAPPSDINFDDVQDISSLPRRRAYFVYASTGCTCCSRENHYRGPWRERKQAEAAAARYHEERLLASQYARNGRYTIEEKEAELLPDGRIIIENNRVMSGFLTEDDLYGEQINGDV